MSDKLNQYMVRHNLRKKLRLLLFPFSLLYGIAVFVRNKLFDFKILKSTEFDFPVISVGNITVGGTGKTPHVEYLAALFPEKNKLAILSRGYKRKTKGFLAADKNSTPETIGDEPFQMFSKFKNIIIAVDENRVHGINMLKEQNPKLQAVILDDALQHRYLKPGISILLIDYYRPLHKDLLLPAGDLRESRRSIKRADIVIVTKTPDNITGNEISHWQKKLKLNLQQSLFFTGFEYEKPIPVFSSNKTNLSFEDIAGASVLSLTGIANPAPFLSKVKSGKAEVASLKFPDHHEYTQKDLQLINSRYQKLKGKKKLIITTEKDAIKLNKLTKAAPHIQECMYYLPIKVKFQDNKQKDFDSKIF